MSLKPSGHEPINSLWVGNKLSVMELLTLKSFTAHGHPFILWIYEPIKTVIPKGVTIKDANEILDESHVFTYRHANQYGHGKDSLAGFSDVFRYKLLYEMGGWWVDMDVTCLRPFAFKEPYFFRAHHDFPVVGNVMKCPAQSPIMKFCFEESLKKVGKENRDWNLPIRILNEGVEKYQLKEHIHSNVSPPDQWHVISQFLFTQTPLPERFVFIHWLNEVWRSKKLSKNEAWEKSAYGLMLESMDISFKGVSQLSKRLVFALTRFLLHRRTRVLFSSSNSFETP